MKLNLLATIGALGVAGGISLSWGAALLERKPAPQPAQTAQAAPPARPTHLARPTQPRARALVRLTGKVFEDPNYGGGAGRAFGAPGTVGIGSAFCELYTSSGLLVSAGQTATDGTYSFDVDANTSYTVRVVNSFASTRPGGAANPASLRPVQTYNGTSDHVGGEAPEKEDADVNSPTSLPLTALTTVTQTPQSIATVLTGPGDTTGPDFGFCFDVVVNTNDGGQGSLRQFVLNANALGGKTQLIQAGSNAAGPLPVGRETSIFMIPSGQAVAGLRAAAAGGPASQLTGAAGAARAVLTAGSSFQLSSLLTSLDATTQTYNVGNTNAGQLAGGYVGPVGTGADGRVGTGDELTLTGVDAPEVEINGSGASGSGFVLSGIDQVLRGFALYGYGQCQALVQGVADRLVVENNAFGLTALGGGVAGPASADYRGLQFEATACDGGQVRNNVLDNFNGGAISVEGTTTHMTVRGNEVRNSSTFVAAVSHGLRFGGVCSDVTVEGNRFLMAGSVRSNAVIIYYGPGNTTGGGAAGIRVRDNTILDEEYNGIIVFSDAPGGMIGEVAHNLINGRGTCVKLLTLSSVPHFTVSLNSFFGNGGPYFLDGVAGNDGLLDGAFANRGMDYPVFTSASLAGSTLTVTGYVGSAAGQGKFGGSAVEVFKADVTGGNLNGEVVLGDALSVPHGEGKKYLGTLTADISGNFSGTLAVPAGVALALGDALTATASKLLGAAGEPAVTSLFGPNRRLTVPLTGVVFEDVNYGGGAGRNRATSAGVGRPGAVVELYDAAGVFLASTTSGAGGSYSLDAPGPGLYTVRVVNASVTSSRPGYVAGLVPVQTFMNEELDLVGGQDPQKTDAGANTGSQPLTSLTTATTTAQSVAGVLVVAGSTVNRIDFGFNFSAVVNTNIAGQGSLRQFMLNANALGDKNLLTQAGRNAAGPLPTGRETSIFMIPSGEAVPGLRAKASGGPASQLTGTTGAARAVIGASSGFTLSSPLTALDATTQTQNVGNTNAGKLAGGYLGPVGTGPDGRVGTGDEPTLTGVDAPEVEINGNGSSGAGFTLRADELVLRGLSVYGFATDQVLAEGVANRLLLENNALGLSALGSYVPGPLSDQYRGVQFRTTACDNSRVLNNVLEGFSGGGIYTNDSWVVSQLTISGNEVRNNGTYVSAGEQCGIRMGGVFSDVTVQGNRLSMAGITRMHAIVIYYSINNSGNGGPTGVRILDNTLLDPYYDGVIVLSDTNNGALAGEVSRNLISGANRQGIWLWTLVSAPHFRVSRNSVYGSGRSSLILSRANGTSIGGNDGIIDNTVANNGLDYPIFTGAALSGSSLTLSGYVGSAPGQSQFGGSLVEVFKADDDGNQNGEIVLGDGKSVAHGEGRTFLGELTADANGNFSGTLPVPAGVSLALGDALTATATKQSTTEPTITSAFGPNRRLTVPLAGLIFEDANYGGGLGRDLTTSAGVPRPEATVELFDQAGALLASTLTNGAGAYSFDVVPGTYTVRVVSGTVRSARPDGTGGPGAARPLAVLTYRTAQGAPDPNRVGGENPALPDAGPTAAGGTLASLNTATTVAQCQSPVVMAAGAAGVTGVDFGFNFDLIVNTNDAGPGSLRQFIFNANALGGESNLAQAGFYTNQVDLAVGAPAPAVALPRERETSIFMIPSGEAVPGLRAKASGGPANQLSPQGVAVIAPASYLGNITGPATAVNGLTQTYNVGNTNNVLLGTGGTVGVDNLPLARLNGPEVRVQGTTAINSGLRFVSAANVSVLGLNVYGFGDGGGSGFAGGGGVSFDRCPEALAAQNVLAPSASAFGNDDPGPGNRGNSNHLSAAGSVDLRVANNLVAFAEQYGFYIYNSSNNALITNNELVGNGQDAVKTYMPNIDIVFSQINVVGNRLAKAGGSALFVNTGAAGTTLVNNTIEDNGQLGTGRSGVSMSNPCVVRRNVIRNNLGSGLHVRTNCNVGLVSENSIYGNGGVAGRETGQLGIDLEELGQNSGSGVAPYVTRNDAGDSDAGGNGLLNFPVLETATVVGGDLVLSGFATPSALLEVFVAAPNTVAAPNATGNDFGQGQTFLFTRTEGGGADADATTGSYGVAGALVNGVFQGTETNQNRFRFTIPLNSLTATQQAALNACGARLTATATLGGATSEFSGNVVVRPAPVAIRIKGDNPLCAGTTVRLSAGPRPGALFTWLQGTTIVNGAGSVADDSVFVASAAGSYTVRVAPAACPATSATSVPLTLTVLPVIAAGTIGTDQTLCAGAIPASLTGTAAPTGGTGTFTFQWQLSTDNLAWTNITSATAANYTPDPVAVTTYFRRQAITGTCAPVASTSVVLTVLPVLTAGSIGTDQTLCAAGDTPAQLTSTNGPGGGNSIYAYQWQSSPDNLSWTNLVSATTATYAPGPVGQLTYFRRQVSSGTGSCSVAVSNAVKISLGVPLAAGSIGGTQSLCPSATPASLPSTVPATGSTAPYAYQWESSLGNSTWTTISGATNLDYAPGPLAQTTSFRRRVSAGSGGPCAASLVSNEVTLTITPGPPATVALQALPAQCAGSSLSFVPTYTNAGVAPTLRWFVNNAPVFTGPVFTSASLSNNDQVRVELTPTAGSCAANVPTATVSVTLTAPVVPAVSIQAQIAGLVCAGVVQTFSVAGASGAGSAPQYQWLLNGAPVAGATGPTFSTATLATGDRLRVQLTSNAACASPSQVLSNELLINLQVSPTPSVTISLLTAGPVCATTPLSFALSAATNLGASPTLQWLVDGQPVAGQTGPNFTATLRDGQLVSLRATGLSPTCSQPVAAVSNPVRATVVAAPIVSAGPDKEIAEGESVVLEGTANGLFPVSWTPSTGLSFPAGGDPLRPLASPTTTTTYKLKASVGSCQAESQVTVKVGPPLSIPSAFSPDGDGINDTWVIGRIGKFPNNTVQVFNRWGNEVFTVSSYGPGTEWGGTNLGRPAPIGTYYYVIKLGDGRTFSGPLTVLY